MHYYVYVLSLYPSLRDYMKSLTFVKTSWHFLLVSKFTSYNTKFDEDDLCTYVKYVLYGFFNFISLAGFIIFSASIVIHTLICLGISAFYGVWVMTPLEIMLLTMIICYAVGMSLHRAMRGIMNEYKPSIKLPKDSFIKNAYKSHKEKFCVKVDFK